MDAANLVIGAVMLVGGGLGLLFLIAALVITPQPRRLEAEEVGGYPSVDRLVMPLAIPIGVALAIAAVIFLVSQILLIVPEAVATPIALVIALLILGTCAFFATARRINRGMIYTAIGVPALVLVLAGGASMGARITRANRAAEAAASAPVTSPAEITTDNKFSKTTLKVPSGQAITLSQINQGQALHNWHVVDAQDDAGNGIKTDLTQSGQTNKVVFTISKTGTYKFQCDVHPTEMIGTLTVE